MSLTDQIIQLTQIADLNRQLREIEVFKENLAVMIGRGDERAELVSFIDFEEDEADHRRDRLIQTIKDAIAREIEQNEAELKSRVEDVAAGRLTSVGEKSDVSAPKPKPVTWGPLEFGGWGVIRD